mgnify:CR=1 FL=1
MSRGSVSDRFVSVMGEIERIFPNVTSDHPDFYVNHKLRELALAALDRGIGMAFEVCDSAEGVRLTAARLAQRTGESL